MGINRSDLIELLNCGAISPDDAQRAATAARVYPTPLAWRQFLNRGFLLLGGVALAFGLMFFIAYNWLEFNRFAKFALIEGFIVAATLSYLVAERTKRPLLVRQTCLTVASLGLGALLALYGQVYQTGADTWQLFFNWAMLMLPWLLLSRFSWLWLIWCGLLNITLMLWSSDQIHAVALLNTALVIAWEFLASRINWLNNHWALRILLTALIASATLVTIEPIIAATSIFNVSSGIFSMIGLLLIGCFYRWRRADLFALTLVALSLSIIVLVVLGDQLFGGDTDHVVGLALMSIATLCLGATVTFWLKRTNQIFATRGTS